MATLREIKNRIASVKNTQQITRAMKMVAAAKLRKSQQQLIKVRPYDDELQSVITQLAARTDLSSHTCFMQRPPKSTCYVLVTAEKGMCGSFNSTLIKTLQNEWENDPAENKCVFTIGRKGYDYFNKRDYRISYHKVGVLNNLKFYHARQFAAAMLDRFEKKRVDRVIFIYNEFQSVIQQNIRVRQVLPIVPQYFQGQDDGVVLFDPKPDILLDQLVPMTMNYMVYRILLESVTSEFGARMTAMETATENANEMIKNLVLYYNQARQAAITNELNEIVGGAEALKG